MYKVNEIDNITVLENYIENDNTFTLSIFFKTGSVNEKDDEKGMSHFLEHMMFNGTNKRTSSQINEILDFYGTYYNAYTTKDHTKYYISSLSNNQKEVLDVFFDMISDPIFPEEQISKEKEIVFEEIRMCEDDIKVKTTEKMQFEIFENNLKYPILGTIDSVNEITRDKLTNYYKKNYTKDNMLIAISGKYDSNLLKLQIEKYFKNVNEKNEKYVLEEKFKKVSIFKKEKMNQVNIFLVKEDENKTESIKKIFLTSIIEIILGDGFSSRLFKEVREKRSLAYEVYNFSYLYDKLGIFGIYIGSSRNKYEEAIKVSKKVLYDLKKDKISEKELIKAKNCLQFMQLNNRSNQKNTSRMLNMYDRYKKIYEDSYIQNLIQEITLNEVNERIDELIGDFSTYVIGDIDVR